MKLNTIKALSLTIGLALPALAAAQNLNPTIEVTNDFITSTQGAERISFPMEVPDSINQFRLNFDYDVFSNPYRGAYKFVPYNVKMAPEARSFDGSRFYLKAGAGYTLHPVFTLAWSPIARDAFSLNFYQNFKGYLGTYRAFDGYTPEFDDGHDFSENFVASASIDTKYVKFQPTFSYDGAYVADLWQNDMFHNLRADLRAVSKLDEETHVSYDVNFSYSYGSDALVGEQQWRFAGSVSPFSQIACHMLLDYQIGYTAYTGAITDVLYNVEALPHFAFSAGPADLSLGVKGCYIYSLHVYPDVKADLRLFKGALDVYAGVVGGDRINTYSAFKLADHHFLADTAPSSLVGGYYRERINAYLGLGGCIKSVFQFDFLGGFAALDGAPMYSLITAANPAAWTASTILNRAAVVPVDYSYCYIDADMLFSLKSFELRGAAHWRKSGLDGTQCFTLPSFSADGGILYTWRGRLKTGLDFDWCSERMMTERTMASYLDLGAYAEYRTAKNFAFWLRGGNLCNKVIERVPFVAEKGISITAGICLDLR